MEKGRKLIEDLYKNNIYIEAVAGMMDEDKDTESVAAKEMKEEVDVDVDASKLTKTLVFNPSCGGSDEEITIHFAPTETYTSDAIIEAYLETLSSSLPDLPTYGVTDEGEQTARVMVPTSWLCLFKDVKLMVAGYHMMSNKKNKMC